MSVFVVYTKVNTGGKGKIISEQIAVDLEKEPIEGFVGMRRFVEDLTYEFRPENLAAAKAEPVKQEEAPQPEVTPEPVPLAPVEDRSESLHIVNQKILLNYIQNLKDHICREHFSKCFSQINLLLGVLGKINLWSMADNPRRLLVDHKKGALSESVKLAKLMYGQCVRFGDKELLDLLLVEFGFDRHSHYIHTKKGKIRLPAEGDF